MKRIKAQDKKLAALGPRGDKAERTAVVTETVKWQADLEYIENYPGDRKYVSLYAKIPDGDEEEKERIVSNRARQRAEVMALIAAKRADSGKGDEEDVEVLDPAIADDPFFSGSAAPVQMPAPKAAPALGAKKGGPGQLSRGGKSLASAAATAATAAVVAAPTAAEVEAAKSKREAAAAAKAKHDADDAIVAGKAFKMPASSFNNKKFVGKKGQKRPDWADGKDKQALMDKDAKEAVGKTEDHKAAAGAAAAKKAKKNGAAAGAADADSAAAAAVESKKEKVGAKADAKVVENMHPSWVAKQALMAKAKLQRDAKPEGKKTTFGDDD